MNEFVSIADALAAAVESLQAASDSPRLDAELLLARAIDVPRTYLLAHPEDTLDADAAARFTTAVDKRRAGMPIAYITGVKEFWSLELMVTPDTLIPRPETELLVEQALGFLPRRKSARVLDLGTGSGAIAIALASERPNCRVLATDRSRAALAVARENARQHDLANVDFAHGDWTAAVPGGGFDVVVCNPPYVRQDDPALADLAFEPRDALDGGADGFEAIRRIAADAFGVTAAEGVLLIEHGAGQSDTLRSILEDAGWTGIRSVSDLAGLPRVVIGRREG